MAIDNPSISAYKRFFIQKTAGVTKTCYDTLAQWGLIAKANPHKAIPTPKEPYKNEPKDADGDDEYMTKLYYESHTIDVQFYVRAKDTMSGTTVQTPAAAVIRTAMNNFFTWVKEGRLEIYDEYTAIGRESVRFAGCTSEEFKERRGVATCVFTIQFKVNNPTYLATLSFSGQTPSISTDYAQ